MLKEELLNEGKFQKTKNKLRIIILVVWLIFIALGIFLIYKGLGNNSSDKLLSIENKLKEQKESLEASGLKYNTFTN